MSVSEIIRLLREKNLEISVADGNLRIRGNKLALDDAQLVQLLREHKQDLIEQLGRGEIALMHAVPPNLIPADCAAITPAMVPLVALTQSEIDAILAAVPGGAGNVQDIYPLAPLQEGILFHHMLQSEGDAYLLPTLFAMESAQHVARYVQALQAVIDRHDILRTAVLWEGLSEPVQVVWRRAPLVMEELTLTPAVGDVAEQLRERFDPRRHRFEVRRAPGVRLVVAEDPPNRRWLVLQLMHHLLGDQATSKMLRSEIQLLLLARANELTQSLPFRNFVAQARTAVSPQEHEQFFRRMLADVDEPTVPFGLHDALGDGSNIVDAQRDLDPALCRRLRHSARTFGVSSASLCHLAWAMVLARAAAREDVVFGTLLLGRMQGGEGSDRALGIFINTLPVRIVVGDGDVRSAVRRTHELLTELLRHEHASLPLAQRCSAVRAPTPLFTAIFNYRHNTTEDERLNAAEVARAWSGIELLWEQERTNYPFALAVDDFGTRMRLDLQVDRSIDPQRICEFMQTALESLVDAMERTPTVPLRSLNVLPAAERAAVLALGDGGPAELIASAVLGSCLYSSVAARAQRCPEAIAIVEPGRELTYRELVSRANGVAQRLHTLGVGAETRVAILTDRSADALIGVLGILAAGAAYVPLDPFQPEERLCFMLEDAAAAVLLTTAALRTRGELLERLQPALQGRVVVLADVAGSAVPLPVDVRPEHAAYVIYTSGSTGTPKGVLIEQRSAMNLVHGFSLRHEFAGQRLLMIPPLFFDASVGDVFPALAVGATLVLHSAPTDLDAAALQSFCQQYRVTAINAPAALWRRWTEDFAGAALAPVLPGVQLIMFGGEGVPLEQVHRFAELTEARITLVNHYGPTEATVCASMLATRHGRELGRGVGRELSGAELPIGRPLPGVRLYVLDRHRGLLPRGVEGELFIGGAGVARGYLGAAAATTERFVPDLFAGGATARMYASGDLVRWNSDGTLQFLGRNDNQVKIRGYRIELGEIEARLAQHPSVRDVVIVARADEGEKRLVAYVTARQAEESVSAASINVEALRRHLSEQLPPYMVPAAYLVLESLPLTSNGKLDRKALPQPHSESYARGQYAAPQGELEQQIAQLWSQVLKLERVGRHDNFFELGGHSLLAATQMARLRQALKVEVALKELFAHPVLQDFAQVVRNAAPSHETAPIPLLARTQALPLSYAQQRLWFLAKMQGASEAYHIPIGLRLSGQLNAPALRRALDQLMSRHEALRTCFRLAGHEPVQHILPAATGFALLEHDLSARVPTPEQLSAWMRAEASAAFDLEHGPLVRGQLLQLAEREHLLLITMHHILSDAWSMGVLVSELSALYRACCTGEPAGLPALPIQYADYAVWQRQHLVSQLQQQREYWQRTLQGAPPLLTLATDRPRPAEQSFAGAQEPVVLDARLTRELKLLSQRHGMTLYMILLAGWAAVLCRLSGQEEVVIGTPVANRPRTELEGLIGFFVNTQALRVSVSGSVRQLLERVRTLVLEAQEHQALPFEKVVEALKPPRTLAHTPIFQVMLAWQNAQQGVLELPGLSASLQEPPYEAAKFDLELSLSEAGEQIVGALSYATALFDPVTVQRHLSYLYQALSAMVANEQQPAARIELLSQAQQRQLLQWNEPQAQCWDGRCIHERFAAQVRAQPQARALVYEDQQLSYGELNAAANRLAHYLRSLGIDRQQRVGICVPCGVPMVVGVLAILKAGAGYVPLDPTYPSERLKYLLEDSAPQLLLTQGEASAALGSLEGMRVLDLQADAWRWADQPQVDPAVPLGREDLAYVIYTSGSTGMPKGVMVEHGNVARLFTATERWFQFGQGDVWTLFHSYAFDFSVWEMWGALAYGGVLVIVPQSTTRSPQEFYRLLCDQRVTVLNQTPSAFRQLIAAQAQSPQQHCLRYVIFGGEALEVAMLEAWYERTVNSSARLINMYGITETTVHVTYRALEPVDAQHVGASPIGSRIPDLQIYILDEARRLVPIGVAGELYIGGAGVARGYLNRPQLTAERFIADPFSSEPQARLYKTGDVGRYLGDGNIEFLGRNDSQVKIRGYRIELGEIEARLAQHPSVRDAVIVAHEDGGGEKRLVAYVTARQAEESSNAASSSAAAISVDALRRHLSEQLPQHMVPAAYLVLESLPLTSNGKLDRKALPQPHSESYARGEYAAPQGELEQQIAQLWSQVLNLERVGRHDNFFELGGHSLLAVALVERMREAGLQTDVRAVFATATLAALAAASVAHQAELTIPPNLIAPGAASITPALLPLVNLTQAQIDQVLAGVPGGAGNVQDIYPLAPLQEGILFHHLLEERGDVYLTMRVMATTERAHLDKYAGALQAVIDRHDILRTAIAWEGLPEPVQVVWRRATLLVEAVSLDPAGGDVAEQLRHRFDPRQFRIDVRHAPMWRLFIAADPSNHRWVLLELVHHLVDDNTSLQFLYREIEVLMSGRGSALPAPLPFRDFVAQARASVSREEHERFFRQMLGDVEEPTAPFGLRDARGDGSQLIEVEHELDLTLGRQLRACARTMNVSVASMCHLAWALLLARVSGRDDVVFGTVMFGRMQASKGADRAVGLFINTLPLRIKVGEHSVRAALRATHALLTELLHHEHAPLWLAQQCSAVRPPLPLFTSMLNYRHIGADHQRTREAANGFETWAGMQLLWGEERTNYPLSLSINDLGTAFSINAQVVAGLDPRLICAMMHTALVSLVEVLQGVADAPLRSLEILPVEEQRRLLSMSRGMTLDYPRTGRIHELFEARAAQHPELPAVVCAAGALSYGELNRRANQLAHYLRRRGVAPDARVGICVERSFELIIGLFAILKSGGAYVPLDPAYPAERLRYMLDDSAPVLLLTDVATRIVGAVPDVLSSTTVPVLDLTADAQQWADAMPSDPNPEEVGLTARHLAYVIYTSGSTGAPKGVMVEHGSVVNLIHAHVRNCALTAADVVLQFASVSFDASVEEVFAPLAVGARIVLRPPGLIAPDASFLQLLSQQRVTVAELPTAFWREWAQQSGSVEDDTLRLVVVGGEKAERRHLDSWRAAVHGRSSWLNTYGPTEATVYASSLLLEADAELACPEVPIGRPIPNTHIYVLDEARRLVPIGVAGELYVGGAGVARGYLNRPQLTAERFIADPFSSEPQARLYRTGDVGRYLGDGSIDYLGRNDSQVKIRGYRIELGEIEARLAQHASVRDAVIVACEEDGEKRLVAYVTARENAASINVEALRRYLSEQLPQYMVPAAYMVLASLPLTSNGKLDRKALPQPHSESYARGQYAAPQGALEQQIAQLWSQVLKLERVGRHDNFFELGGHSLLIVKLMSQLRQFGLEATVAELFNNPTLEAQAALLQRATAPFHTARGAVRIRGGVQAPVFLVHDGYGDELYFPVLAQHLPAQLPVYGLPCTTDSDPQLRSLAALAERMVGMIRKVQPTGPYRLAGWSFGGVLAYEIAHQLLEAGQAVEFLGLLDTFAPQPRGNERAIAQHSHRTPLAVLAELCDQDLQPPPATSSPDMRAAFEALFQRQRALDMLPPALQHLQAQEAYGRCSLLEAHSAALDAYRPAPLAIPVHLFVAAQRPTHVRVGNALGWQHYVPGHLLRVQCVPGSHDSMLKAPHVSVLGESLSRVLADAVQPAPDAVSRAGL